MFDNWEKGITFSQFVARLLAEGFPDDPELAHRELDRAYEQIKSPVDDPTTGANDPKPLGP